MRGALKILLTLMLLFSLGFSNAPTIVQQEKLENKDVQKIFLKFEDGLNNGTVDKFSNYFFDKTYISLTNGVSGYYSSNQSYYVIKDFLSVYQPKSFKLNNIVPDTPNPFASGSLKFNNNGIRGSAMVFISLKYVESKWHIAQITIN